MRSRVLFLGVGVALGLLVAPAHADDPADDRARARDAYDRGAAAHARGDHAAEARELALADAIVPNPVTLQAAIEAAIEADDPVLGVTLCDRAQRGPVEGPLAAVVQRARARFAQRVGSVRVDCMPVSPCAASIDGDAIDLGRLTVVRVGPHMISVDRDGQVEQKTVDVKPERAEGLMFTRMAGAPPARTEPPPPSPPPARGPSPGWFIVALGSTVIAGGVTVGLGVDTASKHSAFVNAGCAGPVHGDCTALASDGTAAQLRTNVLAGVTAALGAATVVAGVLTFRARGAERAALSIGPGPVAVLRVPLPSLLTEDDLHERARRGSREKFLAASCRAQ